MLFFSILLCYAEFLFLSLHQRINYAVIFPSFFVIYFIISMIIVIQPFQFILIISLVSNASSLKLIKINILITKKGKKYLYHFFYKNFS